jgi:hypothetical protein
MNQPRDPGTGELTSPGLRGALVPAGIRRLIAG